MRHDHFSMLPDRAFQPRPFGGMTLEGGKGGGSAPSPDPNIGLAQKQLADLAVEQWDNFKTDIWPEIKEQYYAQDARAAEQFELDKTIQLKQMAIADEEYARRREVFRPIEDQQIAEAMEAGGAADQEKYAALALGDARMAADREGRDAEMRMQSYGIDSQRWSLPRVMVRAVGVNNSALEARAANMARQGAEQLGWAKRVDALALGSGQFGNQATSTGLALNAGNSALNAGQTSFGNAVGMSGAYNGATSTAMSGWNSVGQLGVDKYKADVSAYSAQQQANASGSAGFGSLAGQLGAAWISKGSDRRIKKNIEFLATMTNGLGVYSFEYKDEFKPRWGYGQYVGFMADEVEQVVPEAVDVGDDGYKTVNYHMVLEAV